MNFGKSLKSIIGALCCYSLLAAQSSFAVAPAVNMSETFIGNPGEPMQFSAAKMKSVNPTNTDGASVWRYAWDFGDCSPPQINSTSTAEHTYIETGTYTVTVALTNRDGHTGVKASQAIVGGGVNPFDIADKVNGENLYLDDCEDCHGDMATGSSTQSIIVPDVDVSRQAADWQLIKAALSADNPNNPRSSIMASSFRPGQFSDQDLFDIAAYIADGNQIGSGNALTYQKLQDRSCAN